MTTISAIPPGLVLIAGGLLLPLLHGTWRNALMLALPLITLWLVWQVPDGAAFTVLFLGHQLAPLEADTLSRLFATIFSIMAFAGGLFAMNQSRTTELAAALVYSGSAIGVAFAGDLITMRSANTTKARSPLIPARTIAGLPFKGPFLLESVLNRKLNSQNVKVAPVPKVTKYASPQ